MRRVVVLGYIICLILSKMLIDAANGKATVLFKLMIVKTDLLFSVMRKGWPTPCFGNNMWQKKTC